MMAGREKISLYMIFLIMTFGTIGLISFQTLKERKNSTILLVAKYKEIDSLNNQYEELLEATKRSLLQAKDEKENLISRIKDLENNSQIYYNKYNEDKEKLKTENRKEVTNLKEILRTKDIELANTNAKVEALKHNNKKVDAKTPMENFDKNNLLKEGFESFIKNSNAKTQNSKIPLPQKIIESNIEESNIIREAKVEDLNGDANFEDNKISKTNHEENQLIANKVIEDEDDAKELEVDMKLSDFDGRETIESQIQE